jgi:hypothetical protein
MPMEDKPTRESQHMAITTTPADLLTMAVQQGSDIATLERLMDLKDRWDANEARKAFNVAFAQFKGEAIRVIKGTVIADGPLKGKKHANLFDVVVATAAPLAKHGLTTAWKLTKDEPALMEVTCVLKHSAGHSESVSMSSAPDTGPGRNAIQARGSAKSYLERYTLTAILGLAATDQDDDGSSSDTGEALDDKAGDWVRVASGLEHPADYNAERKRMKADYGDDPTKIPAAVIKAFNTARDRVTPKD